MRQRRWGEETTETGFWSAIGGAVERGIDALTGGPEKRDRDAKRDDEIELQRIALERAKVEAERERALAAVQQARTAPSAAGGGLLASLQAPSPVAGLPWYVVLGVGGLAAYWVARR